MIAWEHLSKTGWTQLLMHSEAQAQKYARRVLLFQTFEKHIMPLFANDPQLYN